MRISDWSSDVCSSDLTRRPPVFESGPFTPERGRAAVALVEERVRQGLPPASVVSVTGLPVTPAVEAMRKRGVLNRQPMFSEITPTGVRWPDGRTRTVHVILWFTGFRRSPAHQMPLLLRTPTGRLPHQGRMATQGGK